MSLSCAKQIFPAIFSILVNLNEPRHGKPVFWVGDRLRLRPAYSADETGEGFETSDIASRVIIISRQRKQRP